MGFEADVISTRLKMMFNSRQKYHFSSSVYFLLLLHFFVHIFFSYLAAATNEEATILYSWAHNNHHGQPLPPEFSDWNLVDPTPCKWSFITCSSLDNNSVIEINIQSVSLQLPFPANLSFFLLFRNLLFLGVT